MIEQATPTSETQPTPLNDVMASRTNPFLSGLRGILRSYSLASWLLLFENLATRSRSVRVAVAFFEATRSTIIADLMFICFAALSAVRCRISPKAHGAIYSLAIYANERHTSDRLAAILPDTPFERGSLAWSNVLRSLFLSPRTLVALVSVCIRMRSFVRQAQRSGHFLTICQASKFICSYAIYENAFRTIRPKAVVVSSTGHPECWALLSAAQTHHIPTIFAAHASFPPDGKAVVPNADLLLLQSQQCLESCLQVGPLTGRHILWGLDGESNPIRCDDVPTDDIVIGLFLTAPINEVRLYEVMASLLHTNKPKYLLLRPHPLSFLSPDLSHLEREYPGLKLSREKTLADCLNECTVVLSGNSNVHRDALRAGVPTLYVDGIDTFDYDLWRFVRGKFIPEASPEMPIALSELRDFYNAEWHTRFKQYDASYCEAPEFTRARVRRSLAEFFND